jgi:hypothetical protein
LLRDDGWLGCNCLRRYDNRRSSERRHGNRGRSGDVMGCSCLRGSKNRGRSIKRKSGERRSSNHGRNDDLMGYNHLRRSKSRGRSDKRRLGNHWRNDDLTVCNRLGGFNNKRSDDRGLGDPRRDDGRVVLDGLDRLGRGKYLLGCDQLGGVECGWWHGTAANGLGRHNRWLVGERRRNGLCRFEDLGRSNVGCFDSFIFIDHGGTNPGGG